MNSGYLHQTCVIGGRTYKIYCKTGKYTGINTKSVWGNIREFSSYGGEKFSVREDMKLEEFVGLTLDDRITIALIGDEWGSMFFVLNHRNSKYKYYPDSIIDKYWGIKTKWNFIENLILYIRLKITSKTFEKSSCFRAMYNEIERL